MSTEFAKYLLKECAMACGFLISEGFFSQPMLELNAPKTVAKVTFFGKNLALECIFEELEKWLEIKVARIEGGRASPHYAIDGKGMCVRDSLFHMLKKRGCKSAVWTARDLDPKNIEQMLRTKLTAYAEALQKYGKDIVDDSPDVFMLSSSCKNMD